MSSIITDEQIWAVGGLLADFVRTVRTLPEHKRTVHALSTTVVRAAHKFPVALQEEIVETLCTLLENEDLVVHKPDHLVDPNYVALLRGDKLWGDIECPPEAKEPAANLEEDHDWVVPVLKLRSDIWTTFPVTLIPLGSGADGAERHAVVWHRKNLAAWRNERSEDMHEWMDYQNVQERRLMKALRASNKWTVESAQTQEQICVIRMNFAVAEAAAETTDAAAEETVAPAAAPAVPAAAPAPAAPAAPAAEEGWEVVKNGASPLLKSLNDIKTNFPVVWREVPSRTSAKVYAIDLFVKRARELGLDLAATKDALLRALRNSPSWRVLRAEEKEVCRIEMNY